MNSLQLRTIRAGLVISAASSSAGLTLWCIISMVQLFGVLTIPDWLIILGSTLVSIGSEGGSAFQVIEALRRTGRLDKWGILGMLLSQASTASSVIFAVAMLTTRATPWAGAVLTFGAVVNTLLITTDSTFNYYALALHLYHADVDARQAAENEFKRRQYLADLQRREAEAAQALALAEQRQRAAAVQMAIVDTEKATGKMPVITPPVVDSEPPDLAARIVALRKAEPDLTQRAIAERFGVSPSTVSRSLKNAN